MSLDNNWIGMPAGSTSYCPRMSGNASVICCRIGRRLAHILRLLRKSSGALTNSGTAVETRSVPQARRERRSSSSDYRSERQESARQIREPGDRFGTISVLLTSGECGVW